MKSSNFILVFFVVIFLFSCSKKCDIQPIQIQKLNLLPFDKHIIFINNMGAVDTLFLESFSEENVEKSINSPLKHIVCKSLLSYHFRFKEDYWIYLDLEKKNNNLFQFKSKCLENDIILKTFENYNSKLILKSKATCSSNDISEITFKGFKIIEFKTGDGNVWKPMNFVLK